MVEGLENQYSSCYTSIAAVCEANCYRVNVKGDEDEQDKTFH